LAALAVAAPARAGEVTVHEAAGAGYLDYSDPAGLADDLHVSASGETMLVMGATVTAGAGCAAVPGGASCALPAGAVAWDRPAIDSGGGDDVVVVDAPQGVRVFGGAGNDRLTLATTSPGSLYGMDGDDVLTAAGSAALEGGPGDDTLSAGAKSGISGGPGTDRITGSPQDDVLVDAADGTVGDVIACNGGADVTQADPGDTLDGCSGNALVDASKTKYRWRVMFGPRLTIPLRMRISETSYFGVVQAPFAECRGAACHHARFDGSLSQRIASGGVRVKYRGRTRRAVGAGARIRAGLTFTFGDVEFSKGLEFRTRAHALPTVRKRCTVRIPPVTGRERVVPCR
jgi:hypothetical protein